MRNRIVTAVKQRFSIRKLSIGAASVLLGTSLYFMGASAPVVHAATTSESAVPAEKGKIDTNDPVVVAEDSTKNDADLVTVAGDSTKNDADVNNAIDKYAQGKQEKLQGDHAPLIRPSDTHSVTVNTPGDRAYQVGKIRDKIDYDIKQANEQANKDKESIEKYKNDHPQTLSGQDSDFFKNQGLSVGDEKDSEINQISVDHKPIKRQSENIDGIDVIHTDKMTNKEKYDMKINSDNKVIINLQHDQYKDKEITVTYDNLKNSYYLENIDDKINKIKISKIKRTFSDIRPGNTIFKSDGYTPKGADGVYDKCDGPQLIIYNDPSDGFFYNNIKQVSVNDIYYDDKGSPINFDKNDKNKAWIFVTSLNSNGNGGGNVEKVRAQLNNSPANAEKIKGSTVTNHNDGWWYSDKNNWFNKNPDWDNNDEDNRFGFGGTVAFQYHPGMTLQYGADDWQWGSHWACMQTQVVSSLDRRVIIYDHIKDGTENVTGNDDVNMTVHYVMDDGSKAPSDSKQTVNFTETGVKDKVTGKIAWTPADSQTLNDVTSPVLTGYTADIKTAKGKAVNFGDPDINVTVHYIANAQTAKITYIDDTTKNNLDSQAANGKFGQTITFETAPTDEIANYEKQGYVLVSNSFNNQTYAADNSNNVFYVHLKHKTEDVTRNDTVTRTIHYLYDNGNTAQPDKTQTVSFNETGTKDDVTGETTWSNDNAQSVDSVDTPSIVGYTPDKSSIEKQSFKFGDQDVEVTVTYHANAQIAKITYIDDTTKNNLGSQAAIGKFGQAITFETAPTDEIDSYEKQGYVLVSNSFNNQTYAADDSNNVFYVHFVHGTKKVSREHSASFTVHYIYKDGRQAKPDHEQALSFTENGIQDLVTQKITWTPADSQKFDDVVTPVITGYTPDQDKVAGQTANFETGDRKVTVTYLPDVQLGHINYIDDNTGKTLTRDDFSGKTNEHEDYTPIDRIQKFENKGYVFVSSDYPDGGFNFDDNDQQEQVFHVHLKHGKVTVTPKKPQTPNTPINPNDPQSPKYPKDINNTNKDVKRTIDYKYSDGKTAQPTVNDSLHFERTVVIDKVTGDVLSDIWTPSQNFNDVQTPAIPGYTPDKTVVSDTNIGHDHQNIVEHVVYSPDKQHMTITYIDDTTGETLHTDTPNDGVSDQDSKYTTKQTIKQYEEKHYKLVSDSTNGKDLIFDHDDKVDQTYEVHFIHDTQKVNRKDTVTETIDYKFEDGKTAQPTVTQIENFSEDGTKDLVTGETTWDEATSQTFEDVVTPKMTGYTPDKDKVKGSTVNFGNPDINVTVHYIANAQTAKITYIDDTTETKLDSKDASGKFGQTITFVTTPADEIANYEKQGYVYVSNNFDNQTYQADNKSNSFEVHLKHGTVTVTTKNPQKPDTPINNQYPQGPKYPKDINNTNHNVKRTIDYKYSDGKTAQPTVTDSLHFERTVVIDKVTGEVSSDTWTPSQDFNDIQTPAIQGYNPNKKVVSDKNIDHDHDDIIEHVVYSPDKQHMTITYIDDTTGKTLHTDNPEGVSDQDSKYTTKQTIKQYEEKHYKLVSDSTNGKDLIFDHDDNVNQTYEVHFKHGTTTVTSNNPGAGYSATDLEKTVTRTINYLDGEGNSVAQAHDDSFKFTASGTVDKVTGKLVSVDDRGNITGAGQLTWKAENYKFDHVDSPTVRGMHVTNVTPADQKDGDNVKEVTVTKDSSDIVVNVYYAPNGTHQKNAKTVPSTQTVKIVDDQGNELRPLIVDSFTFSRTPDVTDAEGKTTEGQWNATEHTYGTVAAPVIPGYVAEKGRAGGKKATIDNPNVVDQIVYHKLSTIIPVTPDHKPIPNAPQPEYPNDLQDPTNVKPNEPIPNVLGYTPVDPSPITPQDPTKPTEVIYTKTGTISVKYHDTTEDKDLKGYGTNAEGKENDPFTYDPTSDLKDLEGRGYVVDGEVPKIPNKFNDGPQTVVINVKHGTTTVTSNNPGKPGEPVDPKNPEGPKYPKGTELDQVKRTGTQTIHYVGAGDKTPADNKQTFVFTRKITFDDVTGKIISVTPWSVQSHTFGNVDTPVIPGYHADKAVAGGETVTPDDLNKVITVTYAPDGNPGNPSDHGDTPSPEPTPEPEPTPTPNPTPDDQPDSETSSDEHFENVKPKDKLDKNNPKKVDAYKKQRKIIKTKIAKQGHTEIAEPIEDKVTRENNVKVVSDPVENKAAEPKLPQTSEADNSIIGLLGMLLASFAAMFGFDSLHSHDKKHKN